MSSLNELKRFLLKNDANEPRLISVYCNGEEVLQENNTRPRVRELSTQELSRYAIAGLSEAQKLIEIRIVKSATLAETINLGGQWALSWDDGETLQPVQVIDQKNSLTQGLHWTFIVSK